jgi:hypothetical protein
MKKRILVLGIAAAMVVPAFAGVVKKTQAEVVFKGFGKLAMTQSTKLVPEKQWTDTQSDFKGKGLLGGLAAKTVLRSGAYGEIIDLPALSVTRLNPKKMEYTVDPIKKFEDDKGAAKGEEGKEEKPAESDIKIIKSEFKVVDTGETADVNGFPTTKYVVTWTVDWENVRTGEKGTNSLQTDVLATPFSPAIVEARNEETKFSKGYMKALGLDQEKLAGDVLGTSWMSILEGMNAAKGRPGLSPDAAKAAAEMTKIKGYPIVIDGKYFATSDKPKGEEGGESSKGGLFGGLAKKVLKKKPSEAEANEPVLSYRVETLEMGVKSLGGPDFEIPAGYKKKG